VLGLVRKGKIQKEASMPKVVLLCVLRVRTSKLHNLRAGRDEIRSAKECVE